MTDTQAAPAPLQVRVKELEWIDDLPYGRESAAVTPFCEYCVVDSPGYYPEQPNVRWSLFTLPHLRGIDTTGTAFRFPSMSAAKAAAQADYEQRILSALDLSTPPQIAALEAEIVKLRGERERLFDGNTYMADGEIEMSAAEDVLAWLLIERLGCVDDRGYTPNEAQEILSAAIQQRDDAEAEVARLTEALKAIRGEASRARGDQSYRDLARFVLKTTLAALKESTNAQA